MTTPFEILPWLPLLGLLRGIFGHTGGGKTMTLVGKLIWTLLNTDRYCVTNLQELDLPRLNEYLQEEQDRLKKKFPSRTYHPIRLTERLLVIPKSETRQFYRYRSGGLVLPEFREVTADGKKIPLAQFNAEIEPYFNQVYARAETSRGVEYFMSECHRFFPAREFQTFERTMNFYATQHRHLDDNAWIESQFPGQIDSNFRALIVEWYHIRNHYRESFGMFKKRGEFVWRMYYELPKGKVEHADKGSFKLDVKGVASCYKTRGAISAMADTGAEHQPKSKKLPFWVLPVLVVAVLWGFGALIAAAPKIAEKGMASVMGGFMAGASKSGPAAASGVVPAVPKATEPAPVHVQDAPAAPVPAGPAAARSSAPLIGGFDPDIYVRGILVGNGRVNVVLSDGTVMTEDDPELQRVTRNSVYVSGRKLPRREIPRRVEGQPQPPPGQVRTADLSRSAPPRGQSGTVEAPESPEQGPATPAGAGTIPFQSTPLAPAVIDVTKATPAQRARYPKLN